MESNVMYLKDTTELQVPKTLRSRFGGKLMSAYEITPENEVTVKNLLTAFHSESDAHSKYTAYAARAESDGLLRAASMFRATARSEQIQAGNHARVIRRLGGEPKAQIHPFEVKTTLENLTALSNPSDSALA